MLSRTLTFFLVATIPTAVLATDVCVSIDTEADGLTSSDRKAVILIAKGTLSKLKQNVVRAPCSNHYKIAAVPLGQAVIASVTGPKGTRKRKAANIESLAEVYDQLIRALWMGQDSDENSNNAMTRSNVDSERAEPRRVRADKLWTIFVGPALFSGIETDEIPVMFGTGGSYELDRYSIDYGATTAFTYGDNDSSGDHSEGAFMIGGYLGGTFFINGQSNNTSYIRGALTVSVSGAEEKNVDYAGVGMGSRLALGYVIGRASSIRGFIELVAEVPFYQLETSELLASDEMVDLDKEIHIPLFGLVIGGAFTSSPSAITVRHR